MNANITVEVNTPIGLTETAVTGENLGQGSMSAGVICALALDDGVRKNIASSKHEVCYEK